MQADRVNVTVDGRSLTVEKGVRISDILLPKHGVSTLCSGKGICRKCRVRAFGELSALSAEETACFKEGERQAGYRLACCTHIEGPCTIYTDSERGSRICASGVMPQFEWDPTFFEYGAAIDIGTTTLALHLYDAHHLLAEVTASNPQLVFGADVISRITCSLEGKGKQLASCIRETLSALLRKGAAEAKIPVTAIDRVVITGNTTMLYLLTERDVSCLSRAPFKADHLFGETVAAQELELPCTSAQVYLAPCISAFVGGDITTALLCADMDKENNTALLADIGTNGEIVLWHDGILRCCATAAGPAFEGAGLSMGMAGQMGAIDRVMLEDGNLVCHTIGDVTPVGICGSGVLDAVSCLLDLEQLEESGHLKNDPVVLQGNVLLTGKDIRMIQLAKGAVRAGIETLLSHAGIGTGDLHELAIAGGFGQYLSVASAQRIGLIPNLPEMRIRILGNAALVGADMLLLNAGAVERAAEIADRAQTVDLSHNTVFQTQYIERMLF